jgi:hypothetical protein
MTVTAEEELLHFFHFLSPTVFSSAFLERISGPSVAEENGNERGTKRGYMSENLANKHVEEIQDRVDGNVEAQDLATNSTSSFLSRRSFLGRAGTSTAVAAASVGFPALLLTENVKARGVARISDQDDDEEDDSSRRGRSFRIRLKAATNERKVPTPRQINNGDEARYPNFIGNYSQGLLHDSIGEVDPAAYRALLTAVKAGDPDEFAEIPLGGNVKLQGPQGGLAFDLEGTDSGQLTIPPSKRC